MSCGKCGSSFCHAANVVLISVMQQRDVALLSVMQQRDVALLSVMQQRDVALLSAIPQRDKCGSSFCHAANIALLSVCHVL
jgi:hypothetical protein